MESISVLVVDDEPGIALLCNRVLSRAGYDVISETNPRTAIELLQQKRFDLLVVDIRMPEVDGFYVISRAQMIQPDIAVLKPRADFYRGAHPTAGDVLLIIEVSDSTLAFDRGPKLALYARHAIPEVWVVDLVHNRLHCMREPAGEGYAVEVSLEGTVQVAPAALPDVQIEVAKLFF